MSVRARLAALNPVFALEVRTPRLTLRFPTDEDLVDLAELATLGVHAPDVMPFETPWSQVSSPFMERNTLQWFWQQRTTLQGDSPFITFATVVDGVVEEILLGVATVLVVKVDRLPAVVRQIVSDVKRARPP